MIVKFQRWFYVIGVVAWIVCTCMFPAWQGLLYRSDPLGQMGAGTMGPGTMGAGTETWHANGSFGLQDADSLNHSAPIWNPPSAQQPRVDYYTDGMNATVRWPWQAISNEAHVELDLAQIAASLSLGILALGIIVSIIGLIFPSGRQDPLLAIASSISASLIVAWLALITVYIFSMGYAISTPLVIGVLAAGLIVGIVYGWIRAPQVNATQAVQNSTPPNRLALGRGLIGFAVGGIAGFGLAIAAFFGAGTFQSGALGIITPQDMIVNAATGLGVIAIGWTVGMLLIPRRSLPGLRIGLLVSTTALGVLIAIIH